MPNKATKANYNNFYSLVFSIQHLSNKINWNQLPITTTGDISSSLSNAFVSLGLVSNLVSVSQLVDKDYRDQHSRKIIVKGPKRLGHPNSNVLHDMLKSGFLGNKHTPSLNVVHFDCISYKLGKSKILPFPTHHPNATQPFNIIHSDLFHLGLFLHSKMKCFPLSNSFMSWPSTPQQNEVAERKNRHLLNFVRTLLLESHVLGYLVTHLIILLFVSLVVCVISIFPHKNISSSMHNQFNVIFLVILLIKRAFCVMILTLKCYLPRTYFFFATQYDSLHSPIAVLPLFSYSLARSPQDNSLKKAIQTELLALDENQTWDIVPCPPFVKPLCNKFVFSIKALFGWIYRSLQVSVVDVKNAFLHDDLKEEVYIKLPYGIDTPLPNTICKLKCSLYGLKQAPRVWFEEFRSTYDPSFFLQRTPKGIIVLLVYVGNIVVTGSDQKTISKLKQTLHSTFHMKELSHLTYFLGLEIHYHLEGIFLNQQKYIQDLIQLTKLTNSICVDTSFKVNVKYRRDEGDILDDPTLYRKLVGNLIYYNESLDTSLPLQSVHIVMLIRLAIQTQGNILLAGVCS
ncbi:hypothetical protein CR513_38754, partial [Mucuna pruriens]